MGEHAFRLGSQRSRIKASVAAAAICCVIAGIFFVAGVDTVEVLATLLFAPVLVVAMIAAARSAAAYAVAGLAGAAYLGLRLGDLEDSGAAAVAAVVVARAVSYIVVAHFSPLIADRIPVFSPASTALGRLPQRDRSPGSSEWPAQGAAEVAARSDEYAYADAAEPFGSFDRQPEPVAAGWNAPAAAPIGPPLPAEPELDGHREWMAPVGLPEPVPPPEPEPFTAEWSPDDFDAPAPTPVEPQASARNGSEEELVFVKRPEERRRSSWADMPRRAARSAATPGPTVPTGWVDDATAPPGDEAIPVGYTGELFLPRDLREHTEEQLPPPLEPLGNGSSNGSSYYGLTAPPEEPNALTATPPPTRPPSPPSSPPSPSPGQRGHERTWQTMQVPAVSDSVDPETRLSNATYFRGRLSSAREEAHRTGLPCSVVMIRVPDEPFQGLPHRRRVAMLRELGHQFLQARVLDHLVHLPDGQQHWFAVVLTDTDRSRAHLFERRLRSSIGGYLRSRGLRIGDLQSASLTSPDDDETLAEIWNTLLG